MPGFVTPEFILYAYILILMAGVAVLGFVSQRLSGKLTETKNALDKAKTDLDHARVQFAYIQQKLEKDCNSNSLGEFVEELPVGLIQFNESKNITDWNPAAVKITGIAKLDAVMKPISQVFAIYDRDGVDITGRILSKCFTDELTILLPETKLNLDGRILPVAGFLNLINKNNQPEKSVRFFFWNDELASKEIANLSKELQNFKLSKEQLSRELDHAKHLSGISGRIAEILNVGLITLDESLKIHSLNQVAENFTGQLEVKIKGEKFDRVLRLTNQKEEPEDQILSQAIEGKSVMLPKWTFLSSKNGRTAVSGSVSPLSLPDLPKGLVLAFRSAETDFESEAEEKGFISGAAHDLRAPLTTIRGVIELLNDSYVSLNRDDAKEILHGANESVLHLIDLVNDLLNVSRLEQGRIVMIKKPLDLPKIVDEVVKSFEGSARKKNLYIQFDPLENPVPKVLGDDLRIKEVVNNLVSNAVKYTIRGGITVKQRSDGSMVYLTVEDTGPGIETDSQKLLFRKFQQVGSARHLSHTKSTGLGLYIAKKFARLMDGDLYLVRSEPEKGSVFELKLPVALSLEKNPPETT